MDSATNRSNIVSQANQYREMGNQAFINGDYFDALCNYNQSLILAKSSELELLMSLAYANRSAVYLKVNQFEKCLENIELAKSHGYSADKLEKLEAREKKCREMIEQQQKQHPDDDPKDFFKLSYPANEKIPFIVNCLEIRDEVKRGRGIFTNQDLKAGDVIAIEEPIFTEMTFCNSQCSICFKQNMLNLIPGAHNKMFCSNDCLNEYEQRTARYSDIPALDAFDNLKKALDICGYEELARINSDPTERTVFDYDLSNPNDKATKHNMLKCVASLKKFQFGSNGRSKMLQSIFSMQTKQVQRFKISSQKKKIIIEFCRQTSLINAYSLFNFSESCYAIPIFLPLLHHSCDPNIEIVADDNRFVAVVNRPLKAGDEISITITPLFDSDQKVYRQGFLMGHRQLHCDCIACVEDYPLHERLLRKDPNFKLPMKRFGSVKETKEELKTNWIYLTENMKHHPSFETNILLRRNRDLLDCLADLPFSH